MNCIELLIEKPFFELLPYESHIDAILTGNKLDKNNYYLSMLDMEGISLISNGKYSYDFFIGRNIESDRIYREYTPRKDVNSEKAVLEFFIDSLSNGVYSYLSIDTFFINNYASYKNTHIVHSPLVIGIDLDKKLIKISDFFDFKSYDFKWVSIKEFMQGYFAIQDIIFEYYIPKTENWILKIEKIALQKPTGNVTNKYNTKQIFQDYLEGKETVKSSTDTFSYINYVLTNNKSPAVLDVKEQSNIVTGMRTYEFLQAYIENSMKNNQMEMLNKNIALLNKHFLVYQKISKTLNVDSERIYENIEKSRRLMLTGIKIKLSN
ncbi:Uncharacterised protein [Carnobacterium maltaromaticum]|uniref:hypothetical protein n=1 Tax=Carnobacterium maltaromaticum TaxID=2751 RepID=UPI0019DCD635|nr:hypothetical protein [Carnobacterium maltaromaticum]CAD5897343.1 Uncharacterised protein [Carnobacterium maltaromaticum]